MTRTVFVVGAGSSIAIGGEAFPIGSDLVARIADLLKKPRDGSRPADSQLMLETGNRLMGGNAVSRFVDLADRVAKLANTYNSIDQLTTNNASVAELPLVCKLCIAYVIGRAEATLVGLADERSGKRAAATWLSAFLREYLSRTRTVDDALGLLNELLFVSFNYDRLVEHVLFVFLRDRYELTPERALSAVSGLPIMHPYGSLSALALNASEVGQPIGDTQFEQMFLYRAEKLIGGLRTFGESVERDIPERIQAAIDVCENLVFVGFGFGSENLDLICPPQNNGPIKRLYATVHKVPDRRWRNLERSCISRLTASSTAGRKIDLVQGYSSRHINVATSCEELVGQYSLEW